MSEIPHCDPAQGFVAFPVAIFDLDLSPAAFRLLAELCRMANTDGQCWPSLAQLGRRMGRSRAAVSGYITELRATGVLSTEEQRMANGYNYRLRYTVTFWKAFRAGLRKPPAASKPERTVQRNERPLETKNHNHKKQQSLVLQKSSKLIARWKASVGNAPYPAFEHRPLETDIIEAERLLSEITEHSTPVISADIETALSCFVADHGLTGCIKSQAADLGQHITSEEALAALMTALNEAWQPHWSKVPNTYQLKRLLSSLGPLHDPRTERKLLRSYVQRWKLHAKTLPSPAFASKVAA
ncbi:helix-turn-helix domain-containing protein [Sulfitobacter sp. S190]|uniref:helix-turn-helix domain-containing protein n=1 Tax=Sulfitobacter sp. S190 TaxID=2867022 RepID=UPI0021A77310|nr:helix-turn-helix domain-containing protein [Sulfitobacter sp. S190]UWR24493.1 helix-turn-helix domain-containing protein [Sulfitobacter sp. S190]